MLKKAKPIIWTLGVAVVAAGSWWAYGHYAGNGDEKVSYQTQPLASGQVTASVTATGTLSPLNTVQVGSQVSGRILELFADFNSQVSKGQVIARIDPRLFDSSVAKVKANLQSARANVTKAEAALGDAKQKYERSKALAERKLVATAEVDSALAAYKSAKAQVTSVRASLAQSTAAVDEAKVNLAYTTIVSPIDGTVISRDVDVGQTVAASLQAPTLFTIAEDLKEMELHTSVAESDVGKLSAEMEVTFTVDAFPDDRFRGVVKQIRNSPQNVQNVVTYNAVVKVNNDALKLRPGMTANVTFIVARQRDVLVVANSALRFTPGDEVLAQLSEAERALVTPQGGKAGRGAGQGARRQRASGAKPAAGAGGDSRSSEAAAEGATPPADGAGRSGAREGMRGKRDPSQRVVWLLAADGQPRPVSVKIGISDGSVTEIVSGDVAEGALIITGKAGGKAGGAAKKSPVGGGRGGRFL